MNPEIEVLSIAYHRNGVGGDPFWCVLFRDPEEDEGVMVGVVFHYTSEWSTAVLGVDKLAAGDIAFGSNSWRSDVYAPALPPNKATAGSGV